MTYRPCERCERIGKKEHPHSAWGRSPLCWECLGAVELVVDAKGNQLDTSAGPARVKLYAGRYRYKAVKCGKDDCSQCPHSFYVYLCWRVDGKAREKYLGPALDAGDSHEIPELREPERAAW